MEECDLCGIQEFTLRSVKKKTVGQTPAPNSVSGSEAEQRGLKVGVENCAMQEMYGTEK